MLVLLNWPLLGFALASHQTPPNFLKSFSRENVLFHRILDFFILSDFASKNNRADFL
jgi:hypothetical protein